MKKILISFLFICVPSFVLSAEPPAWAKTGKSAKYPQEQFLTAVGKGADENDAAADSQRNIIQNVTDILVSIGLEKAKVNISPATLLKSFEKAYSYNDKSGGTYYVFGVVDKNMARINIEDDLYEIERALQYRTAIYETSRFSLIPKIRAINELLELYDRKDSIDTLKKALTASVADIKVGEFEREKLAIERKKLFESIVYYIASENFDARQLQKYMADNHHDIITELPKKPVDSDKGVIVFSCKIQVSKTPEKTDNSFDWIADLVLSDAFNENTVLYSKTAAGEENGADDNEAGAKALAAAQSEMNIMAQEFFKSAY
jgi:hypothetical protein